MQIKVGRSLQFYYASILVLTFCLFTVGAKYFWDNGPFNSENISAAYESSLHFDELKNKSGINEIQGLVESDRSRAAIDRLSKIEKRTEILDRVTSLSNYENLEESFTGIKKSLNELISFPEIKKVVHVLESKVSTFQSFVDKNNWRTLTRVSKRVKSRISLRASKSSNFYSYKKLSQLLKSTEKDIEAMEKVTTNSVLSSIDKQAILTKLKTFDTELSMIKRYLTALNNFNGSYTTLNKRFSDWFIELAPQITLSKIEMEKNTRTLAFALFGTIVFLMVSFVGGIFLYKKEKANSEHAFRLGVLESLQEGIIPVENRWNYKCNDKEFLMEFERCREYFHKRISFGTVFQEAVPFSSILLDSNLNVSWANDLFYEHWNLGETHREGSSISWDFLQQYTNLGEDDPVLMAHNQGVAGIYQIQVRNPLSGENLPYEMYVSPVEYSKQKRIMIFFYPLRSLEETLANQTKSIVGPVRKTLDLLTKGEFSGIEADKVKKDFEIAGIGELFEKFKSFKLTNEKVKEELYESIEQLESAYGDHLKLISDLEAYINRKLNLSNDIKSDFEGAKNYIVHTIDLRYELESLMNNTINLTKSIIKNEHGILEAATAGQTIISENKKAFEAVNKTRDEFKSLRGSVDDIKARLNQSLEQTMLFMKKEGIDPKLESSIGKIRLEMKGVEKLLQSFSQVMRSLDIGLSKMALITEKVEIADLSNFESSAEKSNHEVDDLIFHMGRIHRSGQKTDDQVVESLKCLFDSFNLMANFDQSSNDLVKDFHEHEEEKDIVFREDEDLKALVENAQLEDGAGSRDFNL